MEEFVKLVEAFMPTTTALVGLVGVAMGAWINNKFVYTNRLRDEQALVAKEFYKKMARVEDAFRSVRITFGSGFDNKSITKKANTLLREVEDYFIDNSIVLPDSVCEKIDKFIKTNLGSQHILIVDAITGTSKKSEEDKERIIKQLEKNEAVISVIKEELKENFKKIIRVKKK